jgi:AraC-like DNA-binding protein
MKSKRSFEPHLVLKEMALPPGSEWTVEAPGWSFLHVTTGTGYWLHPRRNYELTTGTVLVVSDRAHGVTRASQLGELVVHYFRLQPERLSGLVSWGEQQFLQMAATNEHLAVRLFPPTAPLSETLRKICDDNRASTFIRRLQLLDLFVQAFGNDLSSHKATITEPVVDAKGRLINLLNDTPPSELLDVTFADLMQETRCTARHLSRIFHQVVGMSFREKQAQVRLMRAQELLATTESKVVEVALESGYQSLSLFNLMFKRRFGMTPAKWRDQTRNRKAPRNADGRLQLLRA